MILFTVKKDAADAASQPVDKPMRHSIDTHGGIVKGGFIQLRIQKPETHAYDTSKDDFGGISHENTEILF